MKLLFASILLVAAFLVGYQMGRQPDSPDIVGWAERTYHQAADAGEKVVAAVQTEAKSKTSDPR